MVDESSPRRSRMVQMSGLALLVLLLLAAFALSNRPPEMQAGPGHKTIPTFKKIELLKIDGQVLGDNDKIMFGSPEFSDWDGDGKTDLILGYWAMWSIGPRRGAGDGGKVRFYKNISDASVPEFKDMGDLECHGGLVRLAEA